MRLALWCVGLLTGLVMTAASAPERRPSPPGGATFSIEHLLTLDSFSDLSWSPDGRRLAFVVSSVDTSENATNTDLWMADFGVRGEPMRLTRHPRGDSSPTFSPSGDTLAFVSNRGTGEDAKQGIYMMSLLGGEPWPFGSYDESVGEVRWSPDGRYLAYVKTDTLPKRIREWRKKKWDHAVEDERLQYPHLWVVEIATGTQRRLTSGELYVWNARWAPDSRSIAFLVSPTGKPDDSNQQDIGVVPVTGGPVRKLNAMVSGGFAWSPDGRWIAYPGGTDRGAWIEKTDLWITDPAGGKRINLTRGFDEDAGTPAWSPSSDTVYFHSAQGVTSVLAAVSLGGRPVELSIDRRGDADAMVASPEGRVAWVQSSPSAPAEVWVAESAGAAGRAVTSLNAEVSKLALATTSTLRWTSSDGVRVEGLLLRPPGASPKGPLKTLVSLHGGPYTSRNSLGFQTVAQYLAARGYQIFMPNFRSSGGYGTAFMVRKRSDWGFQDWRDVTSGIDSLVRWRLADGKRLGVYGRSYGGYLSAWAITQTDRFDAACVFAGAVDLASHWGQSDIQRYRAYEFEGPPWRTRDKWERSSPFTYIERIRTPTSIQVGENDARVPMPQAQVLYRSLLALGVPTEFVHYPREGHTLREPRHRADLYTRMARWFDRWVH